MSPQRAERVRTCHNSSRAIASDLVAPLMAAFLHESTRAGSLESAADTRQMGVSRERLAYDAGVDRSYVGGLLARQTENPTIDLLDQLAKTLELPLSEFSCSPPGALQFQSRCRKAAKLRH